MTLPTNVTADSLAARIQTNRKWSFEYQERRHLQWRDNYTLYRDTVLTNRLTQRQSVNVPLMKETVKTLLSRTDEAPDITFGDLGGDEQRELYCNEYWNYTSDENKLELLDIVDKKQVLIYGRSFIKINIVNGFVTFEVIDPIDVLVDKYCDPSNLESANHVIHQHIYRTLDEVMANSNYDGEVKNELKTFMATETGLIKSAQNRTQMDEKHDKLKDMGFAQIDEARIGTVIVELTEHHVKFWNAEKKQHDIWVIVEANGGRILTVKPLEEMLGVNFYPFTTWADDVEKSDFWSDSVADIVRVPNQILNVWISQLVENRTLRNFGMNYYDATIKNFTPQTFQPQPWGWYPVPGDPNKVVRRVDVPELTESIDEISMITGMAERASAATATEKGTSERKNITLGEVQLIAAKANERIVSIAKFYRLSRKELAEKWYKVVQANASSLKTVTLYKQSVSGKYYEQKIKPSDCVGNKGVKVTITSSSEQEQMDLKQIAVLQAARAATPNNAPLKKIYLKRLLEQANLNPDEIKQIQEFDEQAAQMMPTGMPGEAPAAAPAMKAPNMAALAPTM